MKLDPIVTFRNHAFVEISNFEMVLLCDPWVSGTVFNNSWSLLKEDSWTNDHIRGRELAIWVSHEHPDHLHFPTLKFIRSQVSGRIRFYYRKQLNANVKETVTKLGFEFIELEHQLRTKIGDDFYITCFSSKNDSAALVEVSGKVILNQNDCILPRRVIHKIKKLCQTIDLWLFQFSLAGYYGNEDEVWRLQAAGNAHISLIRDNWKTLRPKIFVPFASFIYFCKEGNAYLNRFRVSPLDALNAVPETSSQLLWFNDNVLWDNWSERNSLNSKRWEECWKSIPTKLPYRPVTDEQISTAGTEFANRLRTKYPKLLLPCQIYIKLRESRRFVSINPKAGTCLVHADLKKVDAEVGDEDLLFFFKFPWGADTLNITANLKVFEQFKWRHLAYLKHCSYVLAHKRPLFQAIVAIAGAMFRTLQYKTQNILR